MIKYPKGQQPMHPPVQGTQNRDIIYGSRGMTLEEQINLSNTYYLQQKRAVIYKKPTPVQVVKVQYPKRSAARIVEAYYRQPSTTDYNGVYQGHYLDFEAKETNNKTRFPLANIPIHQRQHMQACYEQGGVVFLMVAFKRFKEIYLMPYEALADLFSDSQVKSIPYDYIQNRGILCPQGLYPPVDYLKAVDTYLDQP